MSVSRKPEAADDLRRDLTPEEVAQYRLRTGLMHPSCRWCGLLPFERCAATLELCDGHCAEEREKRRQKETAC
jgi:hypothetical protein